MESKVHFCEKLSGETCRVLEERCLRLSAREKYCDMLDYYKMLTEVSGETPPISRKARESMLEPFLSNWREHAKGPQAGKKDMTARPLERELRAILKSELSPLGVAVYDTGRKLAVWKNVSIIADALAEKPGFPQSIFSFKTWLAEGQIRETFAYAYWAKTWLGQKNIRVYMVGLVSISRTLGSLIEVCKPYIDGVFSLCGSPFLDELVEEAKHVYSGH